MKKSLGVNFDYAAYRLRAFHRMVGDRPLDEVTEGEVTRFLDSPGTSESLWLAKYGALQHFFDYWSQRHPLEGMPLPTKRPSTIPRNNRSPHIYNPQQVGQLLIATKKLVAKRRFAIDPATMKTFLLLLYGTGCSVGEARRLRREDVDLRRGVLGFGEGRFGRSRRIPVCAYLRRELFRYSNRRKAVASDPEAHFFVNRSGVGLKCPTVVNTFRYLRGIAGIHTTNGREPTMQDFRATFAVQRLSAWHRHSSDLNKMMPALAAYMSFTRIRSIERYLRLTPNRFGRQLNALSPQRGIKHWRDDPKLLTFLKAL
jgi:integrase/recombinase XerD